MVRSRTYLATILVLLILIFTASAAAQGASQTLTAAEVMQRVIAATGATPPPDTVDTLKAGDPATVVTGIATTFMDTYSVLEKAVASGKNLIITHEPTFYNHLDDQSPLASDPVLTQKLAYIREHHLVVWRFHDTWHLRQPDGILAGMVEQFGWKPYQSKTNPASVHAATHDRWPGGGLSAGSHRGSRYPHRWRPRHAGYQGCASSGSRWVRQTDQGSPAGRGRTPDRRRISRMGDGSVCPGRGR